MKKTLLVIGAVAAGMSAFTANAIFTDYFAIEPVLPNYNGMPIFPAAGSLVDVGIDPSTSTGWFVKNYGPASNAEWQRSPQSASQRASGFTMSLLTPSPGKIGMEIAAPTWASAASPGAPLNLDPTLYCPLYFFNISIDLRSVAQGGGNTHIWLIDKDGPRDLVNFGQTGLLAIDNIAFRVDDVSLGNYGIFMETQGGTVPLQTLQVTGWDCVPEPSSVAMGVIVALGAGGVAFRRYRSEKV